MNYQELLNNKIINKKDFLLNYYHLINLNEIEVVIIMHIEAMVEQRQLITTKELERRMNINSQQIDKYLKDLLNRKDIIFDNYNPSNLIDTSNVYQKIIAKLENESIILEKKHNEQSQTNLVNTFEKEFNRKLSPFEIDMIRDWYERYNDELIIYALKEAVLNGVLNFKYIDKIIIDQGRLING